MHYLEPLPLPILLSQHVRFLQLPSVKSFGNSNNGNISVSSHPQPGVSPAQGLQAGDLVVSIPVLASGFHAGEYKSKSENSPGPRLHQ